MPFWIDAFYTVLESLTTPFVTDSLAREPRRVAACMHFSDLYCDFILCFITFYKSYFIVGVWYAQDNILFTLFQLKEYIFQVSSNHGIHF